MKTKARLILGLLVSVIAILKAECQTLHPNMPGALEISSYRLTYTSMIYLEERSIDEMYARALIWPVIRYSNADNKSSYRFKPFTIIQPIVLDDYTMTIELRYGGPYLGVYFKDIGFKGVRIEEVVLDISGNLKTDAESTATSTRLQELCKGTTESLVRFLADN